MNDIKTRPMFGPKSTVKRRPMFGPKPHSSVWNNMIKRDVKRQNLEKARAVKAEKLKAKKISKEKNVINSKTGR